MICRVCKGGGKQHVQFTEVGSDRTAKKGVLDVDCIWCAGTGEMTDEQSESLIRFDEAWCKCKKSSGSTYYRHDNGAHGWQCNDCDKITQTG
jgi:hypothetical protein